MFFLFLSLTGKTQTVQVSLKVVLPAGTPLQDTIILTGNHALLGNWNYKQGLRLVRDNDSICFATITVDKNTFLEFKVNRGGFYKQALFASHNLSASSLVPVAYVLAQSDTCVQIVPVNWNDFMVNSVTGSIRYHHQMGDSFQKLARDVLVWLPPSYTRNNSKRYPVVYVQDGQNLFDASTAQDGNEWHLDEISDSLMRGGLLEECILVAITSTKERWSDYSGSNAGKAYGYFIAKTLKPFIDKTYRTKPDRLHTSVMGSSMGGVISLYILAWYPEIFSKAACLSGSFNYDNAGILRKIDTWPPFKLPCSIYLDCGGNGIDSFLKEGTEAVYQKLSKNSGVFVQYYYLPSAGHDERSWGKRVSAPLKFLLQKELPIQP
jgi:predicted alpha/beta superfamily hydrolase